jgi:hypothetical protein
VTARVLSYRIVQAIQRTLKVVRLADHGLALLRHQFDFVLTHRNHLLPNHPVVIDDGKFQIATSGAGETMSRLNLITAAEPRRIDLGHAPQRVPQRARPTP